MKNNEVLKNKSDKVLATINLISFIFLLAASFIFSKSGNMLKGAMPNNNMPNANMPSAIMARPVFMPAPYAFSIWILIYVLLALWVVKGYIPNYKQEEMYREVGYWFAVCMFLTGLSILVPAKLSPFFIVGALITALIVYKKIKESSVSKAFIVPFSFLTGWLSVATIANISLVLKLLGVTSIIGIGEVGWAIIMIGVGTAIAILFTMFNNDNIYPLVYIWGYIAIAVQNKNIKSVVIMSVVMCVILLMAIGYNIYSNKPTKTKK